MKSPESLTLTNINRRMFIKSIHSTEDEPISNLYTLARCARKLSNQYLPHNVVFQ